MTLLRLATIFTWITLAAACGDDGGGSADDGPTDAPGCGASSPCGEGKVCSSGVCVDGTEHTLAVDGRARGCDMLLADTDDAKWVGATFGDDLNGSFVQRAPNVGLSVIAAKDTSIPGDQARLAYAGSGLPKVVKSSCVDGNGKLLKGVEVSVQ